MNVRIDFTQATYTTPVGKSPHRTFALKSDGCHAKMFEMMGKHLDVIAEATGQGNHLHRVTGAEAIIAKEDYILRVVGDGGFLPPLDGATFHRELEYAFRLLKVPMQYTAIKTLNGQTLWRREFKLPPWDERTFNALYR